MTCMGNALYWSYFSRVEPNSCLTVHCCTTRETVKTHGMNSIQVKPCCEEAEGNYLTVIFVCTQRLMSLCVPSWGASAWQQAQGRGPQLYLPHSPFSCHKFRERLPPALQGKPIYIRAGEMRIWAEALKATCFFFKAWHKAPAGFSTGFLHTSMSYTHSKCPVIMNSASVFFLMVLIIGNSFGLHIAVTCITRAIPF